MYLFNKVSLINFHGYGFCYSITKLVYEACDNVNEEIFHDAPPSARCERGRQEMLSLSKVQSLAQSKWICCIVKLGKNISAQNQRDTFGNDCEFKTHMFAFSHLQWMESPQWSRWQASCRWSEAKWRSWRGWFMEKGCRKHTLRNISQTFLLRMSQQNSINIAWQKSSCPLWALASSQGLFPQRQPSVIPHHPNTSLPTLLDSWQ